jgi:SAM-dependent methyltransferase
MSTNASSTYGDGMAFDVSSRVKLKPTTAHHFAGTTLFDRIARVLCEASCLPRKELYESWEVARRVRRRFRGGRVVDLACGHGLVAHILLLLDDTSERAVCIDRRIPPSARAVADVLARAWPRLEGRIRFEEGDLGAIALSASDLVVSTHACGALTDRVLEVAAEARARVAVLPCCHDAKTCATGGLEGWLDPSLAIDATRAQRLVLRGYRVITQRIPEAITPKNRLLLGEPNA